MPVVVDAGFGLVFPGCCIGLLFLAVLLLHTLYCSSSFLFVLLLLLVPRCVDCCQGFPFQKLLWKEWIWKEDGWWRGMTWYKTRFWRVY